MSFESLVRGDYERDDSRSSFSGNGYLSRQKAAVRKTPDVPKVSFSAGDGVVHKVFGKGVIVSSKPMGNDSMLEIAFENGGTKKLMANYAKLEKI